MPIEIPPNGTKGARTMSGGMLRMSTGFMVGFFRLTGGRMGRTLLITTVGAKSGQPRTTSIARFDEGDGSWLIVGSGMGSAKHPAWFTNLARNPDEVTVQIGRDRFRVTPTLLEGDEREKAWQRIVKQSPAFGKYPTTTDRQIPVVRLTRAA
jgi:deazaflavin-dependent oxidoreductase (nitroreductase family)